MGILNLKYFNKFRIPLIVIILIGGGILWWSFNNTPTASAGWWNDAWLYRKSLTIDHTKVAGDLADFPALVSLSDTDLGAHAQTDGDDIVFIDREGKKLSHEIESFA